MKGAVIAAAAFFAFRHFKDKALERAGRVYGTGPHQRGYRYDPVLGWVKE